MSVHTSRWHHGLKYGSGMSVQVPWAGLHPEHQRVLCSIELRVTNAVQLQGPFLMSSLSLLCLECVLLKLESMWRIKAAERVLLHEDRGCNEISLELCAHSEHCEPSATHQYWGMCWLRVRLR